MHQWAVVFFKLTMQNGRQCCLVVVQRNISDEAKAPLVDAHQRNAVGSQLATNAQHGSITAYYQTQVAPFANASGVQRRILRQSGVQGSLCLQCDRATLVNEKLGNAFQILANIFCHGLRNRALVFSDQSNVLKTKLHGEITSLKS